MGRQCVIYVTQKYGNCTRTIFREGVYLIFTWAQQQSFKRIRWPKGSCRPLVHYVYIKTGGLLRCIVSLKYSNQLSQHITWNIKAKSGVGAAFGYLHLHKKYRSVEPWKAKENLQLILYPNTLWRPILTSVRDHPLCLSLPIRHFAGVFVGCMGCAVIATAEIGFGLGRGAANGSIFMSPISWTSPPQMC